MTLNLAAMTTGSTLTAVQTIAIPESVANAINQLSANQMALMSQISQISQIAAISLNQQVPTPSFQPTQAPPIQKLIIPIVQPFTGAATDGFQARTGRGGRNRIGRGPGHGGGHNQRTPFANYQKRKQEGGHGRGAGGLIPQVPGGVVPHTTHTNITRQFTNHNLCSRAGSMSKRGTHPLRAQKNGASQITKRGLPAKTRSSI